MFVAGEFFIREGGESPRRGPDFSGGREGIIFKRERFFDEGIVPARKGTIFSTGDGGDCHREREGFFQI